MIAHALLIPAEAFNPAAGVEAQNIAYCSLEPVTVRAADAQACLAKLDRLCPHDCIVDDISFEEE